MPSRGRNRAKDRAKGRNGTPKKYQRAHVVKIFTSPPLIDKRANRIRHEEHIASLARRDAKLKKKHLSSFAQLINSARDTAKQVEGKQEDFKFEIPPKLPEPEQKEPALAETQPQAPPDPPPQLTPRTEVKAFALANIRQLLAVVRPGSFVAFDIDETLVMTRHTPSLLLNPAGVSAFQTHVRGLFPDFTTRNKHCRALQTALKDKVTVESDTVEVVRELQARGCRVFCITARYSELAARTEHILSGFDLDLRESSPFPKHVLQDPETEAVIQNGIVYCNGEDKGVILRRLLSHIVFPKELKLLHTTPNAPPPIPGFYFLDDRVEHTASVAKGCADLCLMGVPAMVFHYRPPVSRLLSAQPTFVRPDVLTTQMNHFISCGEVLTNDAALELMQDS
jgi:hypothetical protein